MGVCIDKLPHSCGTRKGLQVFANSETGKVDGFCFACRKPVKNPYGEEKTVDEVELPKQKTEEEIAAELAEIPGFPTVDVAQRKLRGRDLKVFGIKTALSEEDGKSPTYMYFPITKEGKVSGYYVKTLSNPSYQWSVGDVKKGDLFNWQEARKSGAYRLIITEGREDAVAVDKIYRQYGKEEYHPAVVSLPNGTNSVRSALSKHADDIKRIFREVIICFDDDKAGREALEEAMLILPDAKSVQLPCKDANDCIFEGRQKAAYKSLCFDAAKPKNTRLIFAEDLHSIARTPTPYGELTWPWHKMQELLRGIRYGTTIYVGAGVKMGKSELVNALAAHFIENDGVGVFMAKPEEENKKSLKMVYSKLVGSNFNDPDVPFDEDAYDRAGEIAAGKLMLVDLYQHMGWDTLKKDIISAAAHGARVVFIDPITNLTNGMDAGEANSKLQDIAQDLSAMALDLGIVIFIFCHLKAPEGNLGKDTRKKKYANKEYVSLGNCPHELGGDVLSNQFAGSRAMMRSCNLMLGLEGNRDKELPEEIRNTRYLTILEDREFGNSDSVRMFWNKNTTQFKEV